MLHIKLLWLGLLTYYKKHIIYCNIMFLLKLATYIYIRISHFFIAAFVSVDIAYSTSMGL